MRIRALLALVVFAAMCGWSMRLDAKEPPTVTIVAGERAAFADRLARELRAAGIEVSVGSGAPGPGETAITVVVPADGDVVEVWSNQSGEATLVDRVSTEGPLDTVAVRAAERVRALALAPVEQPPVEPPPATSPPATVPPSPSPPAPAPAAAPPPALPAPFVLPAQPVPQDAAVVTPAEDDVAGSNVASLGPFIGAHSFGASAGLGVGIEHWLASRVAMRLVGELTLAPATLSEAEGSAELRSSALAGELAVRLGPERFGVNLSAGLGLLVQEVSGESATAAADSDETALSVLPRIGAQLRWFAFDSAGLFIGTTGGLVLPNTEVDFGERTVGTLRFYSVSMLGFVVRL